MSSERSPIWVPIDQEIVELVLNKFFLEIQQNLTLPRVEWSSDLKSGANDHKSGSDDKSRSNDPGNDLQSRSSESASPRSART